MTQREFDAAMPAEFWREVVDRVAAEVPDTLLLAEAFWLLEGYFVRTLGMHRVYNSAFMHMLRDEDNAGYRRVIKETLEFDPEILKRYVNFMNNPDEKTAVEQFGKGDKYFGVATMLATLPGLPMLGHGQFEGFAEKYGMEFRRATLDEPGRRGWSPATSARSCRCSTGVATSPRRATSCCTTSGTAAASTSTCSPTPTAGRRPVAGRLPQPLRRDLRLDPGSVAYAVKDGDGSRRLGPGRWPRARPRRGPADDRWLAFREQRTSLEYLRSVAELRSAGLHVALRAYETRVFWEVRELYDPAGRLARLAERLERARRAVARGRAARAQLGPSTTRCGRHRRPVAAHRRAVVEAVAEATGTAGDRAGGRGPDRRARGSAADGGRDRGSRRAPRCGSGRCSRRSGRSPGGARRADEPGLVRGAAARAGRRRRAARPRARRGRPAWWAAERVRTLLDLPLPGNGGAGRSPDRLVDAWLSHPPSARSSGSTPGRASTGSTASRGWAPGVDGSPR